MTPDDLGFYWFSEPNKGMFSSNVWKDMSIFSIKDIKQFVMNVPGTYPAWQINGEMICGMMSPILSTFPNELKISIQNYWILDEKNVRDCFDAFKIRSTFFLKKLGEDFNLLTFVIRLPDHISHLSKSSLNGTFDYIALAYLKIDKFLGTLMKTHYFDNIIIFSDHGLTRFNEGFNFRRWLEKKGLLFLNVPKKEKYISIFLKIFDLIRPYINIRNLGFLYKYFAKFQKRQFKKGPQNKKATQTKKSIISFRSGNVGTLYLRGNDILKKDRIRTELRKESSIKEVIEPIGEDVPDFFIVLQDKYFFDHKPGFFVKRKRSTIGHKEHGIFLAYGNDIKKDVKFDLINYQSIAPTILRACHHKVLDHMKGTTLDIFKDL